MARVSPLRKLHHQAEAAILPYAPAGAGVDQIIEVVGSYGDLELEYAAVRKGCVLVDQPHRGLIEVTGGDRLEFLNRMITQELKNLQPLQLRRSFWLNRKGRIDADLRLIALPDRILFDLDIHAVERTVQGLSAFVITEDVVIRDITESHHRLALHGPTSAALLASLTKPAEGESGVSVTDLAADRATRVAFENQPLTVFREDFTGEVGLELILPLEATGPVFQRLIETGASHDHDQNGPADAGAGFRLRPAGWHALNIARLEAGRPVYNLDFGPDSLPAETGVLKDRVSFTKGCYLGQEIVARMHARGHPKRQLVALKIAGPAGRDGAAGAASGAADRGVAAADLVDLGDPRQPDTGAPVFLAGPAATEAIGDPIGAITSSAISPMLGAASIAFAQVKFEHTKPGTSLLIQVEEDLYPAMVQPALTFWSRSGSPA